MDEYLKNNLDVCKSVIKKDWDMIICVDGPEGSGKSVLGQQMAYYCDNNLHIDRICFTPSEFKKGIMNAKPFESVIYDEAYTGLSSRAAISLINRTLVSMLAEIRQRNLFVFIIMPSFFDLDKYAALWRSRALVHVYIGKGFQRGYFEFYNSEQKKHLYVNGKKYYAYNMGRPNFRGRFTDGYMVDETEYRKKKRNSLTDRENKREAADAAKEIQDAMFAQLQETDIKMSHVDKMKILGMPQSTYFYKLKQFNDLKEFS